MHTSTNSSCKACCQAHLCPKQGTELHPSVPSAAPFPVGAAFPQHPCTVQHVSRSTAAQTGNNSTALKQHEEQGYTFDPNTHMATCTI